MTQDRLCIASLLLRPCRTRHAHSLPRGRLFQSQSLEASTTVRRHGRPFRSSRARCDAQRCRLAGSILIEVMLQVVPERGLIESRDADRVSLLWNFGKISDWCACLVSLFHVGYLDVVCSASKDASLKISRDSWLGVSVRLQITTCAPTDCIR